MSGRALVAVAVIEALASGAFAAGSPGSPTPYVSNATFTNPMPSFPNDIYGLALAMSADGSIIVIGSPRDSGGHVYVYVRPAGDWPASPMPAATLADPAAPSGTIFGIGIAVSADGSTVAVLEGVPSKNAAISNVAVFLRPAGGWSGSPLAAARLPADGGFSEGTSIVAISDDGATIVAGQPFLNSLKGQASVFVRPPGGWSGTVAAAATLAEPVPQGNHIFGISAAVSGDGSIVGVGAAGSGSESPSIGKAYVFSRPGGGWSGAPAPAAILVNPSPYVGDGFGLAVSMSADARTIAAQTGVDGTSSQLLVYSRPGGGWAGEIASAAHAPLPSGGQLEIAQAVLSGDGRIIFVGLIGIDSGKSGSLLVFDEPAGGWTGAFMSSTAIAPPSARIAPGFGFPAVSDVHGENVLVSDLFNPSGGTLTEGTVFLFEAARSSRAAAAPIKTIVLAVCRGR